MKLDHAVAGDLLERFVRARCDWDGDAWVDLYAPGAESYDDPFEPPVVGHLELRRKLLEASTIEEQVELTIERHWVVPPTILAAWHGGFIDRRSRARVRFIGFLTLEIDDDRRIQKARYWYGRR